MSIERPCIYWDDGYCKKFSDGEVTSWCIDGPCEYENPSNADRIRSMSDEELAKFIPDWSYTNACKCDEQLYVDCNNECEKCVLEWLKQPVEETDNEN